MQKKATVYTFGFVMSDPGTRGLREGYFFPFFLSTILIIMSGRRRGLSFRGETLVPSYRGCSGVNVDPTLIDG